MDRKKAYQLLGILPGDSLEKAKALFARSIRIGGEPCKAYNGLGLVFFLQGSYRKAKEVFLQGIKSCPEYAPLKYNLSCVCCKMEDFQDARKYLKQAIAIDPLYREKSRTDPDLAELYRH